MSHKQNKSGNPSSVQSIPSERQSKLIKSVSSGAEPYYLDVDNDPTKQNLIDSNFCVLSNLRGLIDTSFSIASALPENEDLELKAGSFIGFVDSIARQVDILEALNHGLSGVIFDLRRDHEKQCEAYKLQLSVLRDTCDKLLGGQS